MKKILLFSILFLCSIFSVNAQRNLEVILKSDYSFNLLTADIDSITFNLSADSQIVLFQGGLAEGYGINFNRIDTLKFNSDSLELDEPMNGEFEAQLAQLPDTVIPFPNMIYDDGQSVYEFLQEIDPAWLDNPPYLRNTIITDASSLTGKQQKKLFLGRMFDSANNLVTRSNHSNISQPNGLAYVFGGKHIQIPINPSGPINPNSETSCPPDPGCSDQSLLGLDCSGMLGLIAQHSGVPIMSGPSGAQSIAQNWNNVFNADNSHKYSKLKYNQFTSSEVPPSLLKQGDIVSKPGHIGIILSPNNSNSVLMYQSNGQPRLCPTSTSLPCTNNISTSRGPRTVEIGTSLFNQLFGSNYSVLRLDTIIPPGCQGQTTVQDTSGNIYQLIGIGNQCWFAENLKTDKFADGSIIDNITNDNLWMSTNIPAWSYYDNNVANGLIYGKLYNNYVVSDSRNVCPTGWHVPTTNEFTEMVSYLYPPWTAGDKLKSLSFPGYSIFNPGVDSLGIPPSTNFIAVPNNLSGFSALPNGYREGYVFVCDTCTTQVDLFLDLNISGSWWSTSPSSYFKLHYQSPEVTFFNNGNINDGRAIRCVKD